MFGRRTSGSVVCPSCGSLVGVRDERCYSCGRANPGMWGFAPALRQLGNDLGFVPFVIGTASVVYLLSLLVSAGEVDMSPGFNMLGPGQRAYILLGASGAVPVFGLGHWWTVLSAIWLHAGLLHFAFNMLSVRSIGPITAEAIGPARTVIIYVVAGAAGFVLSSVAYVYFPALPFLRGASVTVGASGCIFGLIGALVHYGRVSGSSAIHAQAKQWAIAMVFYALFMQGVDTYAHLGGFIAGYVLSAFFNPLTRERGDHILIAVAVVVMSLLAIVASFWTGRVLL